LFRFFKHIFNIFVIILAVIGVISLINPHAYDGLSEKIAELFSMDKTKVEQVVGDFSDVDKEFNIDTAVNVLGYKTVVAKHTNSGQRMIIVDSGKKTLLTENDIKSDGVKYKLEDLSKKFKYKSADVENIEITQRGYMNAYGRKVPFVKFNAKISGLPKSNISGIISVVDNDSKNQKLIVSINDKKHYSQLITSEFYRNVKESKK